MLFIGLESIGFCIALVTFANHFKTEQIYRWASIFSFPICSLSHRCHPFALRSWLYDPCISHIASVIFFFGSLVLLVGSSQALVEGISCVTLVVFSVWSLLLEPITYNGKLGAVSQFIIQWCHIALCSSSTMNIKLWYHFPSPYFYYMAYLYTLPFYNST